VLAWRSALEAAGIAVWRIHRRVGMSGGLFVNALLRETGHRVADDEAAQLQAHHALVCAELVGQVRPLPGARELLAFLSGAGVPWAIATSGRLDSARPALAMLDLAGDVPLVTRDQVERAKPDPDLFVAAARRLAVDVTESVVIGDSVWDCWPRTEPGPWAWDFCRVAMDRRSSSGRARTASIRTPPIYCANSTRSACAPPRGHR
jgi:HAD superfamily hydrolase (TIGR01509 family)